MKLTNNRYYFDFNATSPLSQSVFDWLRRGDTFLANPASIHTDGKKSKRLIEETTDALYELFGLDENQFSILFHSGATEGVNTLIKGRAQFLYEQGKRLNFTYVSTDHACITEIPADLGPYGHLSYALAVDRDGEVPAAEWQRITPALKSAGESALINCTWGNNETGVVFDFAPFLEWKEKTGGKIHVDAVQSVAKIENWEKLDPRIDAYTFSAHKFGALKGVGFSFVKKDFEFTSLLRGGDQQTGMRSGTQNVEGIYSIKLALSDIKQKANIPELYGLKKKIETEISQALGDRGEIIAEKASSRTGNTICLKISGVRADTLLTAFDLAGMDISTGSACSSATVKPSRVLLEMGYSENEAKSAVRLSFSPLMSETEAVEFLQKIIPVLKRFL